MKPKRTELPAVPWGRILLGAVGQFVVMAGAWAAGNLAMGRSAGDALAGGAMWGGLMVTAFTIMRISHHRKHLSGAPRELTLRQRERAVRASRGGPIPLDPALRVEALRLARALDTEDRSSTTTLYVIAALVIIGAGIAAVVASPWWGVLIVLWVPWCAVAVYARGRSSRRIAELEHAAGG